MFFRFFIKNQTIKKQQLNLKYNSYHKLPVLNSLTRKNQHQEFHNKEQKWNLNAPLDNTPTQSIKLKKTHKKMKQM